MTDLKDELERLERHYARLLEEHGDTPAAVQQRDAASQERRMHRLCEIGDLTTARVLDFGCGTGHLLEVLRRDFGYTGAYTGYDLSQLHLDAAGRKFPDARFERRDILADGIAERFDVALVNGVFNNRISDNWGFMTAATRVLFEACETGLAFNMLTSYVDYEDEGLYYARPEDVFAFCKTALSPFVTLRHDYRVKLSVIPFEFTIYVYRER
ncbi:MAG: methyltransferase domain-containing protein [Proteobacteria bacterium]|nr:methyltransferase domain-containing protein [Pseudomonadota bacterium]